jgi:L-alanine-DL-glutamate epimerase-like enolase superfamily enzyme
MIGCMGESSISISAGASIAALFDYVDLDSHLNLLPDPATGAMLENGIVLPTDSPGHGAQLC